MGSQGAALGTTRAGVREIRGIEIRPKIMNPMNGKAAARRSMGGCGLVDLEEVSTCGSSVVLYSPCQMEDL